jgi:hypothetical protein
MNQTMSGRTQLAHAGKTKTIHYTTKEHVKALTAASNTMQAVWSGRANDSDAGEDKELSAREIKNLIASCNARASQQGKTVVAGARLPNRR